MASLEATYCQHDACRLRTIGELQVLRMLSEVKRRECDRAVRLLVRNPAWLEVRCKMPLPRLSSLGLNNTGCLAPLP